VSWSVTVTEEGEDGGGDGEVYEDDDRDGTIYISDIAAGDYGVTLNPSDSLSDYILPQDRQLVSVKATIEYKVIANIKDEIKSEKEVNVALEDPNGNQAADVETGTAPQDTVEWVESTKTANGEEYIEATPDLTKTAAKVKKENGLLTALNRLGNSSKKKVSKGSLFGLNLQLGYTVAAEDISVPVLKFEIKGSSKVTVGESITLNVDPESGTVDSWTTSKDGIVEISASGNSCTVTGKAEGTVDITAKGGDSTHTVTITVEKKAVDLVLDDTVDISISGPNSVEIGSSITVKATCSETVSWSVSDSNIVTLKDKGDNSCQITGNSEGKVTLTASCKDGDSTKSTTMDITVKAASLDDKYSSDAQLYDANKNPLYVKDMDSYRLATYGDYKSGNFTTYYRKQEGYLYTGWQNIDGRTYYYRSDHTYVTGDQVIQGIKYSFGSDGVLSNGTGTLGIDVSKYQPNINWSSVKASGVNFVIIRCGYRGASTGALIQDPYFTSHIKGAKAAGLKVGVYFFTTALNETEAVEEASMCAALCSGYGINYPIFIDCENSSRPGYNSMSASERTAIIKAFCSTIKSAGYTPGVYANKTWFTEKINASALSGCKIWLAQYNASGPTYSGRYDIWQYTSKGHVDGIPGNVDMNQSYLGY
ncbi:MAG: hypothetical protein IKS84_07170, partial [Lachnospiraceae bacterium]|nr:hypothetical protein [Lachnospiraceae bacterium]